MAGGSSYGGNPSGLPDTFTGNGYSLSDSTATYYGNPDNYNYDPGASSLGGAIPDYPLAGSGYDFTDFDVGGYGEGFPVVLDLDGDGIEITPENQSNTFFDMDGDGYKNRTAWAGVGDGVLALDENGDGKITQENEVVFTDWDPTATTDMQALHDVFDTNHDNLLDAGDARFDDFRILRNNDNGSTSLLTLAQAHIASIGLSPDKTSQTFDDGSSIDGESTFTMTNGATRTAASVTFAYEAEGYFVKKSAPTKESNGSTTIDNTEFDAAGTIVGEITSNVLLSADGLTRTVTLKADADGDGVFEEVQSDVTDKTATDGSVTETVRDEIAGILQYQVATTTRNTADGKTVTILRDADGDGRNDRKEIDVDAADGSKSVTVTDLRPSGAKLDSVTHTVSADGQTGTTAVDLDGDGTADLTTVDQTVNYGDDGTRRRIVTETNANGSVRDTTLLTMSADGLSQTLQVDADGDGTYELKRISTIGRNQDGTTTTQKDTNVDGRIRDQVRTFVSTDGLTTTIQQDVNGDNAFDFTRNDVTVVASDGTRTETITDTDRAGNTIARTKIVISTDGLTRTTSVDSDGNGNYDSVDQIVRSGTVTETVSNYNPHGPDPKSTIKTTTAANGLSKTVEYDEDGDGDPDRTLTQSSNDNGGIVTRMRSASGKLLAQSIVTTSEAGLTTITQNDVDGDGTYDLITEVDKSTSGLTTVQMTRSSGGTLQNRVVTQMSSDHATTTITTDADGDGHSDSVETIERQSDGDLVDTVKFYNADGDLVSSARTMTDANGLSRTTQVDDNGDLTNGGHVDTATSDTTVLNADGSRTETLTLKRNNVLASGMTITTNDTGLSIAASTDVNGDGSDDVTGTSVTTLENDGSRVTTVTLMTAAKGSSNPAALLGKVVTTVSGSGLSTTVESDVDGDKHTDNIRTDVITLNGNVGGTLETVTDTSRTGVVIDKTNTTTSADGNSVTIKRYIDGTGPAGDTETIIVQANGSTIDTDTAYDASGTRIRKIVKTTAANGLSSTQTLYADADGTADETQSDAIVLNADGGTTETFSDTTAGDYILAGTSGISSTVVTQTSGNGLSKTITVTGKNEGSAIDHATTDVTVIGDDGGTTETRTVTKAGDSLSTGTITNAAHGKSQTVQLDTYDTGANKVAGLTDTIIRNTNGSTTETYTARDAQGALNRREVTATTADGCTVSVMIDSDGSGHYDLTRTTSLLANSSRTDDIRTVNTDGTSSGRTYATTTADGSISKTVFYGRTGANVATETQAAVLAADGSTIQTRTDLNHDSSTGEDRLRDRIVTTTSANGYDVTGTIDLDGDRKVDETFSDDTVFNADGSRTRVAQTKYADATLGNRSKTVTTTSANGLTVTMTQDLDGDGHTDVSRVDSVDGSGVKTSTVSDLDDNGKLLAKTVVMVSADGRHTTVIRDTDGNGSADETDVEEHLADGNGSYSVVAIAGGKVLYKGSHTIDENGVDQIAVTVNGVSYNATKSARQESEDNARLDRLYDVMLDRDATASERQTYIQYKYFNQLIDAVTFRSTNQSTEFAKKYNLPQTAEFVEQMYKNAYGRAATMSELSGWLNTFKQGGNLSDVINSLADSAEHLTRGNTHAVTNNSHSVSDNFSLDHTIDKVEANDIADRLYTTGLGRNATATEQASVSQAVLAGTKTEAQMAAFIIASPEFQADYGSSMSDEQFVKHMFVNSLGRVPTEPESSSWSAMLTAGRISRADLLVSLADSPDYYAANNSTPSNSASGPPASSSDLAHSASVNSMIQAMSVMTGASSAVWSSSLATASGGSESYLAAAHH